MNNRRRPNSNLMIQLLAAGLPMLTTFPPLDRHHPRRHSFYSPAPRWSHEEDYAVAAAMTRHPSRESIDWTLFGCHTSQSVAMICYRCCPLHDGEVFPCGSRFDNGQIALYIDLRQRAISLQIPAMLPGIEARPAYAAKHPWMGQLAMALVLAAGCGGEVMQERSAHLAEG